MKIVIQILKECLVNYDRFKRPILFFEMNTVEKSDLLERGFGSSKARLLFWLRRGSCFKRKKQNRKKGLEDEHGKLYIAADVLAS